jgi:hypothetical protein
VKLPNTMTVCNINIFDDTTNRRSCLLFVLFFVTEDRICQQVAELDVNKTLHGDSEVGCVNKMWSAAVKITEHWRRLVLCFLYWP